MLVHAAPGAGSVAAVTFGGVESAAAPCTLAESLLTVPLGSDRDHIERGQKIALVQGLVEESTAAADAVRVSRSASLSGHWYHFALDCPRVRLLRESQLVDGLQLHPRVRLTAEITS